MDLQVEEAVTVQMTAEEENTIVCFRINEVEGLNTTVSANQKTFLTKVNACTTQGPAYVICFDTIFDTGTKPKLGNALKAQLL